MRYWSYRKNIADHLDTLIDKEEIDLVEFPEYGNEAAVWIKRRRGVPLVVRLHTPTALNRKTEKRISKYPFAWVKYHRAMQEYDLIKSADAITSCSKALAVWIKEDIEIENRNIEIIYNPINFSAWETNYSDSYNIPSRNQEIFFAGTIALAKGVEDLVEAVSLLRQRDKDLRLTAAGKLGKLGRRLEKKRSNNPKVASWLRLMKNVPREQLTDCFAHASLVCFPSWWENFPMVCLEAMASGAIVLASSSGGMAEIIEDGADGFLVEPKDPLKLANKIEYILSLPEEKKLQIRKKAQEKIKTNFDMKVVLPKMLQFYEKVISEFNSSQ
jgi:glycogen synthase